MDDDDLRAEDVVAAGGTWGGLLFDNPFLELPPALTWRFTVDCQDVVRDSGDSPVGVTVEWLPLPVRGWRRIAPQHVHGQAFGRPTESSVYFFEHHRFDAFDLVLSEQRGLELRAAMTVSGDLDGLGLDPVSVESWLDFEGLVVHLSDVTSPGQALQRLAVFTDVTGLVVADGWAGAGYCFRPASGTGP